jgi:hypothetical protein
VTRPIRAVLNRRRNAWFFPNDETAFLVSALYRYVQALSLRTRPPNPTLVDLRMDLCFCQWLIDRRLVGVTALRDAFKIEHFCQSDYLKFLTYGEILELAER